MTRRSELMLEDLIGCDHKPTLPVSENGEILYWLCACGREHYLPKPLTDDEFHATILGEK